jgi:hypothetical protein
LAPTNNIAEAFLQALTQAPQPNQYGVCINRVTRIGRNESTGSNDAVECTAIYRQIFNHWETIGSPWLNCDGIPIVEAAHV